MHPRLITTLANEKANELRGESLPSLRGSVAGTGSRNVGSRPTFGGLSHVRGLGRRLRGGSPVDKRPLASA